MSELGKRSTLRVFVDASTIVSGLLFEGNEALLLDLGLANLCELVSSEYVVNEVRGALSSKEFNLTVEEQAFLVSYLYRCMRVYPSPNVSAIRSRFHRLEDKKDLPVLASFEMLGCDFLVTGDKEMLSKVEGARKTRDILRTILGTPAR